MIPIHWQYSQKVSSGVVFATLEIASPTKTTTTHARIVAKDRAMLDRILASPEWRQLEEKLQRFVTGFKRKIILYREGFQF